MQDLGAYRVYQRIDCDVEFEEEANTWAEGALAALSADGPTASDVPATMPSEEMEPSSVWSRKNPFPASLVANRCLNSPESAKDTRHIVLSLADSGLAYEVGDALGLFPKNCPGVVSAVLQKLGVDPSTRVTAPNNVEMPISQALTEHYEIRHLLESDALKGELEPFLASLRKLQPRLYSIASSPNVHPDEVHLTVGAVRYQKDGVLHKGVASTFLADRLSLGEKVPVFIHKANHFRLPADPTKPIIMVGPGTGIAPFRAFLEERDFHKAPGKNWLFFGDQRSGADFLYRDQIDAWLRSGVLSRLSLAFSRDQADKIYVQTRMLEQAAALWDWLEEGAYFYVCGDASRMAKDVEAALLQIIQSCGGKSPEEAADYLSSLRTQKRYLRDVY
jgi:sulfite reductase (NADPH) flavoprotein alpha-component